MLTVEDIKPDGDDTNSLPGSHLPMKQLPKGAPVFITELLDILRYQYQCAQRNFVTAAALTPMHGKKETLRSCDINEAAIAVQCDLNVKSNSCHALC